MLAPHPHYFGFGSLNTSYYLSLPLLCACALCYSFFLFFSLLSRPIPVAMGLPPWLTYIDMPGGGCLYDEEQQH
jgi:hypothetical protein